MADATLALNPVTPLWNGAQVSTANAFPVQLFTSALSGWTYTNIAVSGGTTVQVKASAGTIHGATVNVVSTGAVITLVDFDYHRGNHPGYCLVLRGFGQQLHL